MIEREVKYSKRPTDEDGGIVSESVGWSHFLGSLPKRVVSGSFYFGSLLKLKKVDESTKACQINSQSVHFGVVNLHAVAFRRCIVLC